MRLAFVDTETTGVDEVHEPWEVAIIEEEVTLHRTEGDNPVLRGTETTDPAEFSSLIPPEDLLAASPGALRVGDFYGRHATLGVDNEAEVRRAIAETTARMTSDHYLVGANVAFDASMIERFLRAEGLVPAWRYHLIDVEAMALAKLGFDRFDRPPSLKDCCEALSIERSGVHTALGDARDTRAVFWTLMIGKLPSPPKGADGAF